jgi:hypothetical protein
VPGRIIYCLDPGSSISGFVKLDTVSMEKPILEAHDGIHNDVLLYRIMTNDVDVSCPLIIEYIHSSNGQPVDDNTCRTIMMTGRFVQAWIQAGGSMPVALTRKQIGSHFTHSIKTSDKLIGAAIRNHYGEPMSPKHPKGPLKGVTGHAWQALAVGLAYAQGLRSYSKGKLVSFGCPDDDPEDQRSLMNEPLVT